MQTIANLRLDIIQQFHQRNVSCSRIPTQQCILCENEWPPTYTHGIFVHSCTQQKKSPNLSNLSMAHKPTQTGHPGTWQFSSLQPKCKPLPEFVSQTRSKGVHGPGSQLPRARAVLTSWVFRFTLWVRPWHTSLFVNPSALGPNTWLG